MKKRRQEFRTEKGNYPYAQVLSCENVSEKYLGGLGIRSKFGGPEIAIQRGRRSIQNQPAIWARMQMALDFGLDARREFPL